MVNAKIVVLDPTSRGKLKESITAKRPASLEGKVMGIVWNGKPGGDALLERFGELLTERFRFSEVLRLYAQAHVTNSLTEAEISELAKRCCFCAFGRGRLRRMLVVVYPQRHGV